MFTFKRFLAGAAIILAALGIIICLVVLWFSWSLNTPVTDALVRVATAAERVLGVTDDGLTRIDDGLTTARGAIATVEETSQTVGETLVDTNLAFALLERTVGDTLFPRVVSAHETAVALTGTVVAFNDTLEAANRVPFVDVPTLTSELEAATLRLDGARTRVTEIQDNLRAVKEEKVSRPVTFITDRTTAIGEDLAAAQTAVGNTQAKIDATRTQIEAIRQRLPRWIDLISLAATLALLWLVAAQGYVLVRAIEYLRGRRFDWGRASKTTA